MLRYRPGTGIAAATVSCALLAIAALLGHLNFARWDNTETFLPAIWYAHNELLHGRIALWNPLQQLGEPIHAQGAGAVLYLPYTLAVMLTRLLNWPEAAVLDISGVLHVALGAWGMSALAREVGVRPSLAFAASVSTMLSGFAMVMGSMWVHVIPNLAWSVWAMWGVRRVIMHDRAGAGAAVAALSLGLVFHTGHAQQGANVWLATLLWAVALIIAVRRAPLGRLALLAMAAVLIALPAILPTALIYADSVRAHEQVGNGTSFSLAALLLGSLWPGIPGNDRVVERTILVTPFIAVWLLPALLLGGLAMRRNATQDRPLVRAFVASCAVGLIFVWLQFGSQAGLYSVLHSLPLWSQFRMAFKYWERALPLLALAGAIGLELAARRRPGAWVRSIVPLSLIGAAATIWIAHSDARPKPYLLDRQPEARIDLARSGHRALPLSPRRADNAYVRPISLFYSASLDGYESASGHRFALTSRRLTQFFPGDVAGVPEPETLPVDKLVKSNWVRLADVGHFIIARDDSIALSAVARAFPTAQVTQTPYAQIVHVQPRWPRVYFASEQVSAAHEVLFGSSPILAAAVEGDVRKRALPAGRVRRVQWAPESIVVEVSAPAGSLLVFSLGYSREWQARVNGERLQPVAVNGMFTGLWLPAGATRVEMSVRRWPLVLGLLSALVGFVLVLLLPILGRPARSSEDRHPR